MGTTTRLTILALLSAALFAATDAGASSVCGDVNDSGTITISDALAVLRKAVGQSPPLVCAPLSGPARTGEVTSYGAGSDGSVRAGTPRSFTDNGDGTITDDATGLMWEKKDNAGGVHDRDNTYTWSTGTGNMDGTIATSFLATLNSGSGFAGHKDWRVPNRFELETLLNFDAKSPAAHASFNTACPANCTVLICSCTLSSPYWSSSTYLTNPTGAWSVSFINADVSSNPKTGATSVRAVRGGF